MAKEASSVDFSKLTGQQLEDYLKHPNLSQSEQDRLLDELVRKTTEELVGKTQDNGGETDQSPEPDHRVNAPETKRRVDSKSKPERFTSEQPAQPRSALTRILFFLLASILSFVGIILLLMGLAGDGSTTVYGIACLGVAFWLFNRR